MIAVLPVSLIAQDSGRALLHSQEGVWLNGNPAQPSSAIFADDLVQTQAGHVAKIDADGSTVAIQAETIVRFKGDELVLDHGSLQIDTARAMRVRVNCLTVIPVAPQWTQYDVTDRDGKVTVVARRNDVNIHTQGALTQRSNQSAASMNATVREGEQTTREEHCAPAELARPAEAKGAFLDSWWAKGPALVGVGVIVCLGLLCLGGDPVSPSKPMPTRH